MKSDPGSNYNFIEIEPAEEKAVAVHDGVVVDTALAQGVTFFASVGVVASGSTVDVKLQHSPDNSTWTDEVAGAGNDLTLKAGQIIAASSSQLDVPNPRARYVRTRMTVAIAVSDVCIIAVSGPKLIVEPDAPH